MKLGDLVTAVRISFTGDLTSWSVPSSRSGPELTTHGCVAKVWYCQGRGDLALNSLLVAGLNLKLPRSFGRPKARDD